MARMRKWFIVVLVLGLVVYGAARYLLSQPQFGGRLDGQSLQRAQANALFHDGKFSNVVPQSSYTWDEIWQIFDGQFFGKEVRTPPGALPVNPIAPDSLKTALPAPSLRAFWIGHAGVFIEIDGLRLLVDPVFSDYASPFAIGPKRFHPTPIALADLPPIDAVLITHDHYDHLDMQTARYLGAKGTQYLVPLGIDAHLKKWGVPVSQVHALEWWQEHVLKGVRFVATPSRHYSGRGLDDKNATLWTAWSVLGAKHRFYVSGDTGYTDYFRATSDKFGPFDLAFIKIGAYGPGHPWADIHMSAEDAVQAAVDLRAKRMFPVHWATFNLALHDWDEPIKRTLAAARDKKVDLLTPRVGEIVNADEPFVSTAWWESVR